MYTFITIVGLGITAFFLAGFWRGIGNALADHRNDATDPKEAPNYPYGGIAAFSVLASAAIIAGVGFSPAMIYAGPLLALVTAAGCGLAFFLERKSVS